MIELDTPRAMTQKERTRAMLEQGQTTRGFLRTSLAAEYRKWISIIRHELPNGQTVQKRRITSTNYEYRIVNQPTNCATIGNISSLKERIVESVPLYRIKDLDTDEYIQIVQTDEESD